MKNKKNLGKKTGRIMVFGGVYSNLQALQKMMQIAENEQIAPDNIFNTGDVVAYCSQPLECVQLIKEWGINSILGNVEISLRDDEMDCGCNFSDGSRCDIFSKKWFPFAQQQMNEAAKKWLCTLPHFILFEYAGLQACVLHGSFANTSEYIFASDKWDKKARNFESAGADVILCGHSGLPFSQTKNGKYWLNAGVIGMPANDGSTRVWYMILDDSEGQFQYQHRPFEYDFESAYQLMLLHQLPIQYAETLRTGLWDNCEILPPMETALQGKEILLSCVDKKQPKIIL